MPNNSESSEAGAPPGPAVGATGGVQSSTYFNIASTSSFLSCGKLVITTGFHLAFNAVA